MAQRQYITMIANEDLSTSQYKMVYVDGDNGVKLRVAAGAGLLGIVQNKPQSGEHATIVWNGLSRCSAGATITAGSWITVTASGTAVAATSSDYIVGKAITGVASGSLFQLLVESGGYKP
ncbi:hypothetical protein CMI37_32835 [Candidatus Pacearchaeota archaeon]|nr:hypothetical protein [Candidatus Pacearchaeota archaeon]|tara:strand:+ start:9895 stop:10254 length:360 start_codon:yes stop_codon:yes gene_type:complete